MIWIDDLERILGWMRASNLELLSVREGDSVLTLRLAGAGRAAAASTIEVASKGIGRFLPSHPRRPDTALVPGDRVTAGLVVGYLQAGQSLVPIVAGKSGTVSQILATPGQLLGYGAAVLALIEEA